MRSTYFPVMATLRCNMCGCEHHESKEKLNPGLSLDMVIMVSCANCCRTKLVEHTVIRIWEAYP